MSFYLSQVISVFLLPAMILGLLWEQPVDKCYKKQFWLFLCALLTGAVLFRQLPFSQVNILLVSGSYAGVLFLLLIYALLFRINRYTLLCMQTLITGLAGFMWAKVAKLDMLSATNVINTEFILNISALICGFLLIVFIQTTSAKIWAGCSRSMAKLALFILVVITSLPLSGEIILAAMKLQVIGLTQGLLTYVSRVTNFYWVYPYCATALAVLCILTRYRTIVPLKQQISRERHAIERRKKQANFNRQFALIRHYAAGVVLVFASLLYWDLVASQPLERSPATRMVLAEDNSVHIPVTEALQDGRIHRYDWVASDGKVVRFFVIDRYPGEQKFGVVFDACMLCGDAGYVQSGDQVICLACGVHIFIPSIGKPGGCNPIPIAEWTQQGDEILISQQMLESGLKYFSEIVEITATDPVNGKQLSNIGAEYTYLFGGKTYFFTSEASYEAFRADPWAYTDHEPL
ncbi:DUF2318 domain-containing protein [Vibrio sp. HA2012]|uniref:Fe-S-containing protein n=1 Tax=Vibrio sp. HA2012 TaxID=1971595 RepID=UPI000C2B63E4|nr:Fe-S-containing protein [Vibrio sp. HA2012]PJC86763.1 DUF2318 domain-containing protein [Vibrio sp. HA2012]